MQRLLLIKRNSMNNIRCRIIPTPPYPTVGHKAL
nr:MAG TPA: hypothetical protein [Caudoviricetes sp.]